MFWRLVTRLLQSSRKLDADATRFYAASIASALDYLHNDLNVVCRCVRPEAS